MNTRKEITSTLILLGFGAGYMAYGMQYPVDTWNNPGPSVFPLLVGGVFLILALSRLVQSLRRGRREEWEETPQPTKKPFAVSPPFVLVGCFIVYVLFIQWVGFLVSTCALVMLSSRLMGAQGWSRPIALAIGVDVFCYWVFEGWLKLSLPTGVLF